MCGIVGYIGSKSVNSELISSLKKLEYRGYDSAGVAVIENGKIIVTKKEGKISNLESILGDTSAKCGIAHTRWATHGKPTTFNAHPHVSDKCDWAIVHNGIIENFSILKSSLDVPFYSDTDTEVIAKLLGEEKGVDNMNKLINVCSRLKGSYALACINEGDDGVLYLAKNKSPLYIGICEGEVFVASDPICFVGKVDRYYSLSDNEFCRVSVTNIEFFDDKYNVIDKKLLGLSNLYIDSDKADYPYYMMKEIMEVPTVLGRIATSYEDSGVFRFFTKEYMERFNKVILIGCGTAYHAGLMGAKYLSAIARLDATTCVASEFRYSDPIIDENSLCIFVSQSGETADTLACCELAKSKGATTIALTNVLYSTLASMVDKVLPVCAGAEISVASTKAYTAQITILYMLSCHLRNVLYDDTIDFYSRVLELSNTMTIPSIEEVTKYSNLIANSNKVFFLGRDTD